MRSTIILIALLLVVFAIVMVLDQSQTVGPNDMPSPLDALPGLPD